MRAGTGRYLPTLVVGAIAVLAFLLTQQGGQTAPGGGCPPETERVGVDCFDREPSGPVAGVRAAADRCAARGAFLPTPSELELARQTLDLGSGRGTDSRYTDAFFYEADGRGPLTIVVSSHGQRVVRDEWPRSGRIASRFEFICVYRKGLIIP